MDTAVVLMDLGGPASLEEVGPFIEAMLSHRAILPGPSLARRALARGISAVRRRRVEGRYAQIGGSSPLHRELPKQAGAMSLALGPGSIVDFCFLFSRPTIGTVLGGLAQAGVRRVVAVPTFPQASRATSRACAEAIRAEAAELNIELLVTPSFPQGDPFLECLVERSREARPAGSDHALLVAHGLPESQARRDVYVSEVEATAERLGERLMAAALCRGWSLAYQSRLGPVRWTGPAIEEEIERLASRGVRSLLVVPISFGCENLETLWDLDHQAAEVARRVGISPFARARAPGAHPLFIEQLVGLVRAAIEGDRWPGGEELSFFP